MNETLSTFRTRYLDRASVLKAVLDAQGPTLFSQILQERALEQTPKAVEPRSYTELFAKVRRGFKSAPLAKHWETLKSEVERVRDTISQSVLQALLTSITEVQTSDDKQREIIRILSQSAAAYSGAIVGLNLPNVDIRFFSSDAPEQTVVFRSAPRLFLEVILEWSSRVFAIASGSTSLSQADREFFESLQRMFRSAQKGVVTGTLVRDEVWKSVPGLRRFLHSEKPLPVDAYSLKMAALWVQEMLRQSASTQSSQADSGPEGESA
jgi:hypothetical protein